MLVSSQGSVLFVDGVVEPPPLRPAAVEGDEARDEGVAVRSFVPVKRGDGHRDGFPGDKPSTASREGVRHTTVLERNRGQGDVQFFFLVAEHPTLDEDREGG